MSQFTTNKFLKNIDDVDKDLRVMALFDLGRYLQSATSNESVVVDRDIVTKVLDCLGYTKEGSEKDCDVQSEAVRVLPALIVKCPASEQWRILDFLVSSSNQSSTKMDQVALRTRDMCALALKTCVSEVTSFSQRSREMWQSEVETMRKLAVKMTDRLGQSASGSSSSFIDLDIMYSVLNYFLPHFISTWSPECVNQLGTISFQHLESQPSVQRVVSPCCSALLPYLTEVSLTNVVGLVLKHLQDENNTRFDVFLNICRAGLCNDTQRMRRHIPVLLNVLMKRMKTIADTFETELDASDSVLGGMHYLIKDFPDNARSSFDTILALCEELAKFNPFGDAGGAQPCEYYDDEGYEDAYYYESAGDASWAIRLWALKITQEVVLASGCIETGRVALNICTFALNDTVQDVQLQAYSLLRSVAQQGYCAGNLLASFCPIIAASLSGSDVEAAEALKTIHCIFIHIPDSINCLAALAEGTVSACQRATAETGYLVEAIMTGRKIVEIQLQSSNAKDGGVQRALLLCREFIKCLGTQYPKRVVLTSLASNQLIIDLSKNNANGAQQLADATVAALTALLKAQHMDVECHTLSMRAIGSWLATSSLSPESVNSSVNLISSSLTGSQPSLTVAALEALQKFSISTCASKVPLKVIEAVGNLLGSSDANVRLATVTLCIAFVEHGLALPKESIGQWASLCERAVVWEARGLGSNASLLRLLRVLSGTSATVCEGVAPLVVNRGWTYLSCGPQQHITVTHYIDTTRELSELTRVLYKTCTAHRSTIDGIIAQFLHKGQQIPTECRHHAVRAIISEDNTTNRFLEHITTTDESFSQQDKLLIIGCVGQKLGTTLDQAYATVLLDGVQDKTSETIRSCAEFALSQINSVHPQVLLECLHRGCTDGAVGCHYYLKAAKSGITMSLSFDSPIMKDEKLCKAALSTLLTSFTAPELADLAGGCVGAVSLFWPAGTVDRVREVISKTKDRQQLIVCASAARHMIDGAFSGDVESLRALFNALLPSLAGSSSDSLPLRTMILRLIHAVSQSKPVWLQDQTATMSRIAREELREQPKLVTTVQVQGYTHQKDKGLECRTLAFSCISAIVESDIRGTKIISSANVSLELTDAIINAISSVNGGEHDPLISTQARALIVKLFQHIVKDVSEAQVAAIAEKLKPVPQKDFKETEQSRESVNSTIVRLGAIPAFARSSAFRPLIEMGQ